MSRARALIADLEREIIFAANVKIELRRLLGLYRMDFGTKIIGGQLAQVEKRIGRAQLEIREIERTHFAELASARRNAKYPAIPAIKKSTIRFADTLITGTSVHPLARAAAAGGLR